MARKVLLSFLGTGPGGPVEKREYRATEYHLNDTNLGGYPFVAGALKDYYQVDSVILIGTVHSMWEAVYKWFAENAGVPVDEEVYFRIGTECEEANHLSPLAIPDQAAIEEALGKGSKVVLIKYGLNEEEVRENINIFLGIQQYLNPNDELIVDITHSFRSLPIFMMNLLIYLKNVSSKNITISHIHYGMLEVIRELGYAPIIDLKAMMDVQDWITGAYAFSMFGNSYKIASLLENENKSVGPILRDFSDAMNLNYLYPLQNETQKLSGLKNKEYKTELPNLIVTPVVNQYVDTFRVRDEKHRQSHFQLKLADWQFQHKKYAQAYLTSNDALISYVCEENGFAWDHFEFREDAKKALYGKPNERGMVADKDLQTWFKKHNARRNGIAHTQKLSFTDKSKKGVKRELTPKEIIASLGENIAKLKEIIGIN